MQREWLMARGTGSSDHKIAIRPLSRSSRARSELRTFTTIHVAKFRRCRGGNDYQYVGICCVANSSPNSLSFSAPGLNTRILVPFFIENSMHLYRLRGFTGVNCVWRSFSETESISLSW